MTAFSEWSKSSEQFYVTCCQYVACVCDWRRKMRSWITRRSPINYFRSTHWIRNWGMVLSGHLFPFRGEWGNGQLWTCIVTHYMVFCKRKIEVKLIVSRNLQPKSENHWIYQMHFKTFKVTIEAKLLNTVLYPFYPFQWVSSAVQSISHKARHATDDDQGYISSYSKLGLSLKKKAM